MNRFSGSAVLLAALVSLGAQADDNGPTLQEQREQIGNNMVRERTGSAPIGEGSRAPNQQMPSQLSPNQQSPGNGMNAPGSTTSPNAPGATQQAPGSNTSAPGSTSPSGSSGGGIRTGNGGIGQ